MKIRLDEMIVFALIAILFITTATLIKSEEPQLITVKCSLDIPTTDDIPALRIGEITR